MRTILFVCTGNTCRSPMAEYFARSTAINGNIAFASAGTTTRGGSSPTAGAVLAMAEAGIDISGHRSADIWDIGRAADRIYALSREHLTALRRIWPDRAGDIQMLRPDGASIEDPLGLGEPAYQAARDEIAEAVEARAAQGWR